MNRRLENIALVLSAAVLAGWGAWWVLQVIDVIELLRLAYDW